jgi:NAD(P)-dependent dehydrogenase (short-subunit alcohol dehydrogenase family)
MNGPLDGRTVVITGAGGGVGRGIALACGAAGARVVIGSPRDNGNETAGEIIRRGGQSEWVACDVTRRDMVDAMVQRAVDRFGGLDVMIHNATSRRSSEPVALIDLSAGLFEEHAAVSLRGAYYCAQASLRWLQHSRGRFIVMTSPAGMEGSLMLPAYGLVKAGLRGFAKSLALEWAPFGINVTLVSPLAVTPALDRAYRDDPSLEGRLAQRVPLGRIGDAETDIGPAVVFLAGDGARYITGQTLVVDGGRFMLL